MKYMLYLLLCVCTLTACSDDESLPQVKPSDSGVWEDSDGNRYGWVRIGNQEWMTSNLKAGTPYYAVEIDFAQYEGDRASFSEEEEALEKYGNLYEWETACAVCETLGDGWRLPSDKDWQELERALGMGGDASADGWRGEGVATLMRQGEEGTGLAFQMGGNASFHGNPYALKVRYVKEKAYFWSSTRNEDGTVYYRKLYYNSDEVCREAINPRSVPMMRVRCVRDVE